MRDQSFRFVELTMAVILGQLLVRTPEAIFRSLDPGNYRAVLLFVALLVFLEMYIVLSRYHVRLSVIYHLPFLFLDLLISFLFVSFVLLIHASWDNRDLLATAMVACIILLLLLAARQLVSYLSIRDIKTKLELEKIRNKDLVTPMIADVIGIPVCFAILLAVRDEQWLSLHLSVWAWIAFALIVVYLLTEHVLKIDFNFGLGLRGDRL